MAFVPQYDWNTATEEVIAQIGGRGITRRAGEFLNAAQQRLARSTIDMPELEDIHHEFDITEDFPEYDLRTTSPTIVDAVGIFAIKNNSTGLKMVRFPYREFLAISTQASAQPVRWARRGYHLALDPNPSETITVRIDYRRRPQMDTMETPSEWQADLIRMAVINAWAALGEHERVRSMMIELPMEIQRAIQSPLTQEQWEAYYDDDLALVPMDWDW